MAKDKNRSLPDGLDEHPPQWHIDKLVEFTKFKKQVHEPSPHLAMVGYMSRNETIPIKVWMIGCYGATYCLPSAQMLWTKLPWHHISSHPEEVMPFLTEHWKGVVTRTERRCVRTPNKMNRCLTSYINWANVEFPKLQKLDSRLFTPVEYYDKVWDSVNSIEFVGRYIAIRIIEGLRRYCDIPAQLYDIRSVGGWSPRKALVYFFPEHHKLLLEESRAGADVSQLLSNKLLEIVQEELPDVNYYVIAAMLCEYREVFERRHQYAGWTIDQEPLLYDKVKAYWGDELDTSLFHETREALFNKETLGEFGGWNGTRWDLTNTLRDYGYNWNDMEYDYGKTHQSGDFANPVRRLK